MAEWIVMVTVEAAADVMPALESHAAQGLDRFREYPGFIGGSLHVSLDGRRLVQHVRWVSERHYRACIDDPVWNELPSARVFMDAVQSGKAGMVVDSYRLVRSVDGTRRTGE